MNKTAILWYTLIVLFIPCFSGNGADRRGFVSVQVAVEGFRNNNGLVRVVLFDSGEGFPDYPGQTRFVTTKLITEGRCEVTFESVPSGEYAAAVLHDENSNGKMDYAFFGAPREGYAVSNNVKGKFGPPKFREAVFLAQAPLTALSLRMIY